MPSELIAGIITGGMTFLGVVVTNYFTNRKSQALIEYKIEELTREVRMHNNFAQRVPVLEEQQKVANNRIKDLEEEAKYERKN